MAVSLVEKGIRGLGGLIRKQSEDPAVFRARIEAGLKAHVRLVEGLSITPRKREKPSLVDFSSRDDTPRPNDGTSLGEALAYLMPDGVRERRNGR